MEIISIDVSKVKCYTFNISEHEKTKRLFAELIIYFSDEHFYGQTIHLTHIPTLLKENPELNTIVINGRKIEVRNIKTEYLIDEKERYIELLELYEFIKHYNAVKGSNVFEFKEG